MQQLFVAPSGHVDDFDFFDDGLTPAQRQALQRLEDSLFPPEVKMALTARMFGDPETAENIRAEHPGLFTREALEPFRETICSCGQGPWLLH